MTHHDTVEGGNTSAPSPNVRSRLWAFTWNNHTLENVDTLLSIVYDGQYVFQEETGECGTPHLQGMVYYPTARSFNSMKNKLPKCHLEKGRNKKNLIEYCSKNDTRTGRIWKNIYIKNLVTDPMIGLELYEYQIWLKKKLAKKPSQRKIYWLWEPDGCTGKSMFCKHLCIKNSDYIYISGKASDMKYAITKRLDEGINITCCILDLPRSSEGYISYSGIEEIKNGHFFNNKYESSSVIFDIPHVVVFANFEPNKKLLSEDRWKIKEIKIKK